jgi:hypothetical protein
MYASADIRISCAFEPLLQQLNAFFIICKSNAYLLNGWVHQSSATLLVEILVVNDHHRHSVPSCVFTSINHLCLKVSL